MLPTLITLVGDPDREFTAVNAVAAMGSTGSWAAVPVLLDLLRNPDPGIAGSARYALQQLTHRTASKDTNDSPQSEYSKWENWWATEGKDAPIYKPADCANFVPLK